MVITRVPGLTYAPCMAKESIQIQDFFSWVVLQAVQQPGKFEH